MTELEQRAWKLRMYDRYLHMRGWRRLVAAVGVLIIGGLAKLYDLIANGANEP